MKRKSSGKKRSKPFPATRASRKHLEERGYSTWTIEQRIPHTFITRDAWGFGDVLAMHPYKGIAIVQVTGGTGISNFNARLAKIKSIAESKVWISCGGRILLHSWEKQKDGKRKLRSLEYLGL